VAKDPPAATGDLFRVSLETDMITSPQGETSLAKQTSLGEAQLHFPQSGKLHKSDVFADAKVRFAFCK